MNDAPPDPAPRPRPSPRSTTTRRRGRLQRRLRRRLRHGARRTTRGITRHRVALAVSTAAVAVILGGLLAAGFLASPAGSGVPLPGQHPTSLLREPALAAGGATSATKGSASSGRGPRAKPGSGSASSTGTGSQAGLGQGATVPYNPLNHLDGTVHRVTITVTADGPIGKFGYLVPTGLTSAEGRPAPTRATWSLRQLAIGSGKLAAVFLQTGSTGRRMTCSVRVDGRTTSSETVDRPYARTVCLG